MTNSEGLWFTESPRPLRKENKMTHWSNTKGDVMSNTNRTENDNSV